MDRVEVRRLAAISVPSLSSCQVFGALAECMRQISDLLQLFLSV
jgi:hypothetical protein